MKNNPLNDQKRLIQCLKAYVSSWLRAGPKDSIKDIFKSADLVDFTWDNIQGISSLDDRAFAEELTAMGSEALAARSARPSEYEEAREKMQSITRALDGNSDGVSLIRAAKAAL